MESFLARHQSQIQGTISGFDRLRFVGQMRMLSFVEGLVGFLSRAGVLLKDFGEYVENLSNQIKRATIRMAESTPTGRVHYLASSEQRGHPRLSSKFSLNAVSSALPCHVG